MKHSAGVEAATSPGNPGPSRHLIFAIVAVGLFMSSIDATIVATALSAIHDSLRTTINWAGWTITVYSLGMVIVLPIAGKISDELGRRLTVNTDSKTGRETYARQARENRQRLEDIAVRQRIGMIDLRTDGDVYTDLMRGLRGLSFGRVRR